MAQHEQHMDGAAAGISRRKMIVTGATLAVAGAAVGAAIPLTLSSNDGDSLAAATGEGASEQKEPVMVYVKNAQSGELDVFVGDRRGSFTDRAIAAAMVRAAASAT